MILPSEDLILDLKENKLKEFEITYHAFRYEVVNDVITQVVKANNKEEALYNFMNVNKDYWIKLLNIKKVD